jgi:NAD(P)-dependent dehydrogenase (short-subunit alcohol dehydrogenase family)
MKKKIAIFGAQGAIGQALVEKYLSVGENELFCFSRGKNTDLEINKTEKIIVDISSEDSIQKAAQMFKNNISFDRIIIATGLLHDTEHLPEKSIGQISPDFFIKNFTINTLGPALVAKHFAPLLNKKQKSIFAALSARVGSLSDNRLGGWYSYRSSKTALHMLIKTLSIEYHYKNPVAIFLSLHPGTVRSLLSKPFIAKKENIQIFSPEKSAQYLYQVIENANPKDSGFILDWKGVRIDY